MTTVAEKCARVEKLTVDYPDWWTTNLTDMSIDLLAKLGADPRDVKYFGMHVIQFIRITDALDNDDPDINEVCTAVATTLHPTVDFHKLGIQDDLVADGKRMHHAFLLNDMYDDPALDHPDAFDDSRYDDY